jgi:hypothetical protein
MNSAKRRRTLHERRVWFALTFAVVFFGVAKLKQKSAVRVFCSADKRLAPDILVKSLERGPRATQAQSRYRRQISKINRHHARKKLDFRFPSEQRTKYALNNGHVAQGSFLVEPVLAVLALLTSTQESLGITGGLGEIGVHHGKFFVGLAHLALRNERIYANDVFEKQHLNIDGSGFGDFDAFVQSCASAGIDISTVSIDRGSSADLAELPFMFRLFSVDGGHTRALTVNDLTLAACHLEHGGIIILDDITNFQWPGVIDGFFTWMNLFPIKFAPFFVGYNKVFITHTEYHATYYSRLVQYAEIAPAGMKLMMTPSSNANPLKSAESGLNVFSWLGYAFVYGENSVNNTIAQNEWLKFIS